MQRKWHQRQKRKSEMHGKGIIDRVWDSKAERKA